jgi:predicted nucleic acid-binding protein
MPGASDPTAAVVDASVAVKWVVDEPGSEAAATLLDRPTRWLAPRLMLVEVAAALRRKTSDGELRPQAAATSLAALLDAVRHGVIRLADDEELVIPALLLALDLGHKLPDCVYLTLAEREGCSLSTGDRRLARLARSRKVGVLGVGAAARTRP